MKGALIRAGRFNLLLTPVGALVAVTSTALLARFLGPATFADYATTIGIVAWLVLLAESGYNSGLSHALSTAGLVNARRSLYRSLQMRRWAIALVLGLSLTLLGPTWAQVAGLSAAHWSPLHFFLLSLLAAITLHGQLANYALLTEFAHGRVLSTNLVMSIIRALSLALVASFGGEITNLLMVLILVASVEALTLHMAAVVQFKEECNPLPSGLVNHAQNHGLVSLLDKVTATLLLGPTLLIALSGAHSRVELGLLAIATETLQRALSITGSPLSNITTPILNNSRDKSLQFREQLTRIGGLMTILFSFITGLLVVTIPLAFPLLFGGSYASAVSIAIIWAVPLFFEAGVRMVWGSALLALKQYRWLIRFNITYGLSALIVIFMGRYINLITLLIWIGLVRLFMTAILLHRAIRLDLAPHDSRPVRVIATTAVAIAISAAFQQLGLVRSPFLSLLSLIFIYCLSTIVIMRLFKILPTPSYDAICKVLGKYSGFFRLIVPCSKNDAVK